jgi:outer membrane protein OmpA-like peptidoglycan-associated protein
MGLNLSLSIGEIYPVTATWVKVHPILPYLIRIRRWLWTTWRKTKSEENMSLLTDLFNTLDKRSLGGMADALGESDQSISRGMQSAIGTVLGGMATKSDNPTFLRKLLDLVPTGMGDVSWPSLAGSVGDPNSPMMSAGKRMLSTLFGGSEGMITRALGTGTGMQPNVISSLMAMAAPMVMGFLGKRVHDEGMSMGGLGNLLQREIPAIRGVLPAGVTDLLWPREHETVAASPVVAQTVAREKSPARWVVPLLLLALIPGLFWLFSHMRRPTIQAPSVGTANRSMPLGTANRAMPEAPRPMTVVIPKNLNLYFETGSSRLRPTSHEQLNAFATALAKNPDTHVMISGYTDNVGNPAGNLRLSQQRAETVKGDLIHDGISADRLSVQGFGQEDPVADNTTTDGRQMNRRVFVAVGEH